MITVNSKGETFGTWPVILTRVTHKGVEFLRGTRMGRYGGVLYDDTETLLFPPQASIGSRVIEHPDSWWNSRGWVITDPEVPKYLPAKPSLTNPDKEAAQDAAFAARENKHSAVSQEAWNAHLHRAGLGVPVDGYGNMGSWVED